MIGFLLFAYFKAVNRPGQITESATTSQQSEDYIYEVQKGDNLWKIAEKEYGDGYQWKKIYESNKSQIQNPNELEIGTKLVLAEPEESDVNEYTVQKGDSLWKIAESQCGNGYVWVDIARQNNLKNPRVIHTGNVLKFVCEL